MKPHVVIIGAGFTGCALAHDLALRGLQVTVVERGEIASGTSGRTHGLLHSGGRYCVTDQESARECIEENQILRRIVPQCIEANGGLFIAVSESDLEYKPKFLEGAAACGIPAEEISPREALRLEPNLNPRLLAAVKIPDGTFEPLRLALAFAATARANGARFLTYTEVKGLLIDGQGAVSGVTACDRRSGAESRLPADLVVSAAGAWAGEIAAMAGGLVPIKPTPGVMVAVDQRLVQRPVNRLCEPDDGDIVLPQRRMVVIGTTSFEVEDIDYVPVLSEQVAMMVDRGAELIPAVRQAGPRGSFMSSRPLIGAGLPARSMARTFKCFDHKVSEGLDGFVTITGGKATTCRAMAEKTADVVCAKLGSTQPCQTRTTPLLSYRLYYQ